MEAASSRSGPFLVPPSQPARKEWRAVSESPFQSNGTEETEHGNLGQSDERTIHEEGAGVLDVDFCSITVDGAGLSMDILQQRLQNVARQREELQHMEIELRAQAIATPQILEARNSFKAQIKEHAAATAKLKEQLHEREKYKLDLEMKLEDKDRELRALKIDNEVWAKEDLLREQSKELASFRRERDNSETERSQQLKQIHDLQEHIQEKESQLLSLEEQHRVAQDTILYKDEQIREAHTWIARVQEMDALQSTTNQSLQAELRERTEQFNQYWIGFQRQYAEMERHHLQAIQQLQLELAEARERNGIHKDTSQAAHESSVDSSFLHIKGNQINGNDGNTSNGNLGIISNGNVDGPAKVEHTSAVSVVPSSLLGIGAFFPPSQMAAMHPYMMHPQCAPQPLTSTNLPVPQLGQFQQVSAASMHQHWQNQQVLADVSQIPNQEKYQPSQTDPSLLKSDANYNPQFSAQRQVLHSDQLAVHADLQKRPGNNGTESSEDVKVMKANGLQQSVPKEPEEVLNVNIEFTSPLQLDPPEGKCEQKERDENTVVANNQSKEPAIIVQQHSSSSPVVSATKLNPESSNCAAEDSLNTTNFSEVPSSIGQSSGSLIPSGKPKEPVLLDERCLLACIVRAIPAGLDGRIRISTTLPNRLGKMLAPLHWHDYKKHYGKLDDFVAHHPELFVIEGDFIHLREGAQQIISATTAVAKVAAAAASSPYSSSLPSVAMTPVAQSNRTKRAPVLDSRPANPASFANGSGVSNQGESYTKHSQNSKMHDQQQNGVGFNIIQGVADVAMLNTKLKSLQEENGLPSEMRPSQSSGQNVVRNGAGFEISGLPSHDKGLTNGRHSFGVKQPGRTSGAAVISRR